MIDLHAHVLPGFDDGPPTTEAALGMARAAAAAGTRAIATTPHINHSFGVRTDTLAPARDALAARLADEGIELELLAGGEIAPERLQELDDDDLRTLTLGGGSYVLLECPFSAVASMDMMVTDLRERGFGVLLAHPERSPTFQHDPTRLARAHRARRARPGHDRFADRRLRRGPAARGGGDAPAGPRSTCSRPTRTTRSTAPRTCTPPKASSTKRSSSG